MPIRWRNVLMTFVLLIAFVLLMTAETVLAWDRHSTADDAVQLWTTPGKPFQIVRAETLIAVPLFRLLRLLQDPHTQQEWLPYTHQVEILAQPAPIQTLVRFESEAHWPFAARDAVTLFVVSQPDPHSLRIDMRNQPDAAPLHPGIERIRTADGYWLLTAEPGCTTRVRYEAGSAWGGSVPQWLVNRINRQVAAEALHTLQQWAPTQTASNTTPANLQPVSDHAHCA